MRARWMWAGRETHRPSSRRPPAPISSMWPPCHPTARVKASLCPPFLSVRSVADLKGKKVGVTKGSSAQNLLVAALERAGVPFADITPVYLSPADAAAAFASGKIDAWSIWDPFFAIAELRHAPRVLTTTKDELKVNTYFLANKSFATAHPAVVVRRKTPSGSPPHGPMPTGRMWPRCCPR